MEWCGRRIAERIAVLGLDCRVIQAPDTNQSMTPLSHIPNGHPVVVRTVAIAEAAQTRHLEALGILPGTVLVVERAAPFGGAVMVRVGEARYALGRDLCHQILVEPEAA